MVLSIRSQSLLLSLYIADGLDSELMPYWLILILFPIVLLRPGDVIELSFIMFSYACDHSI